LLCMVQELDINVGRFSYSIFHRKNHSDLDTLCMT
jgi:hypothetical protein